MLLDLGPLSMLIEGLLPVLPLLLKFTAVIVFANLVVRWAYRLIDAWGGGHEGALYIKGDEMGQDGAGGANGADYWEDFLDTPMIATAEDGTAMWKRKMLDEIATGEIGGDVVFDEAKEDDDDDEDD